MKSGSRAEQRVESNSLREGGPARGKLDCVGSGEHDKLLMNLGENDRQKDYVVKSKMDVGWKNGGRDVG